MSGTPHIEINRTIRRICVTAAAVTLLGSAAAVWLAVVMLRTPQHCGWCGNEHR